jgi:hypothetical protein
MHKFPIYNFKNCAELPYEDLNALKFAVYILDFNWNFLFANSIGCSNLKATLDDLKGENLWKMFGNTNNDPQFKTIITDVESRRASNITTVSAITGRRVNVTGYPLEDCYYFSVSLLPDKEDLINDLRSQLGKNKH